jgi:hypothetical protein
VLGRRHQSSIKKGNGALYLGKLENYAVPQEPVGYVLQKDGSSHFSTFVTGFLNQHFTGMRFRRSVPPDHSI